MATENRLDVSLADARSASRTAVIPFVTAGHPDLEVTARLVRRFADSGAAAVEVGFPFSDSIADGPVIQDSFHRVLENGQRLDAILETVTRLRGETSVPLVAMVSYSIVARIGLERFVDLTAAAGFDGLIAADVPQEEAAPVAEATEARNMKNIMLVATSTPPERAERIVALCSGFVYQVAVAGTTGERGGLDADLQANVQRLRSATELPICVGFGISSAEQVRSVGGFADGAIIGSAIVRRITEAAGSGQSGDQIVESVGAFVADLIAAG